MTELTMDAMSGAGQAAFRTALAFTLAREGVDLSRGDTGYVDDPNDPGGCTNYGITDGVYRDWRRARGLPVQGVRHITSAEVEAIYLGYWRDAKCHQFADARPRLALCHFDWAFNGGAGRAIRYLQACVGVAVDGLVGPVTVTAVQACDERATIGRYLELRAAHHRARADVDADEGLQLLRDSGIPEKMLPTPNPSQIEFLAGWLARCRWVARATGAPIAPTFAKATA